MLCLGIETSCDDTGVALVEDGKLIHSLLASQALLHSLFGGVVPEIASREHYRFLGKLFDKLLNESGKKISGIDIVCAARGPGLLGSLLVGTSFAKGLALGLGRPFIGINHLHAHILVSGLENELMFPFIALLASGGHTVLYRVESPSRFIVLGKCLDDAAGEVFDKIGKFMGMPYPAGPLIDQLSGTLKSAIKLPAPYLANDNLNFSFSGLKTSALSSINKLGISYDMPASSDSASPPSMELKNFCAALNSAIADTLVEKTSRAIKIFNDIKSVIIAGGVAANQKIRQKFSLMAERFNIDLICPSPTLCADNGVMIALAGYFLANVGICHSLDMETLPRGRRMPDDIILPDKTSL